jgi:hypothetical protein
MSGGSGHLVTTLLNFSEQALDVVGGADSNTVIMVCRMARRILSWSNSWNVA